MPDDREAMEPEEDEAAEAAEAEAEAGGLERVRRGRAFRVLRDALGLRQQEVADRSGLTSGTVSDYERAQTTPEAENLERMFAEGYRLPLYALQDAEDFVEYVSSLRGRTGGWRESHLLRRGDTDGLGAAPAATSGAEQRRIAASFGQAMGQAMLRFFETFERGGGPDGGEGG